MLNEWITFENDTKIIFIKCLLLGDAKWLSKIDFFFQQKNTILTVISNMVDLIID